MRGFLVIILFLSQCAFSQTIDNLTDSLSLAKNHKNKARIALKIADRLKDANWNRAQYYIEFAEDILKKVDSDSLSAEINEDIGEIFNNRDALDIALPYYLKAYDYYDKTGNNSKKYELENGLAVIYARLNNKERAMHHFKRVMSYYKKQRDSVHIAKALNNIGRLYFSNEQPDSAMIYFKKSLYLSEKIKDPGLKIILSNNLGLIYASKKKFKEAQYYFNKSKQLAEKENDLNSIPWIYNSISQLHLSLKQPDSALHYSQKAYSLLGKNQKTFESLYALQNIYQSYLQKKDYENAAHYFEDYNATRDSLDIETKAMNVEKIRLEQQYKENEELRELKENKKQFKYLLFGCGLVIIVLLLVILLLRYRNRLTNAQLEKDLFEAKKKELDMDLQLKNKELMTHSMMEIQRTEITEEILDNLKQIKLQAAKKETKDILDTVIKKLEKKGEDDLWKEFELTHGQVYQDFYNRLNTKHPELTPREIRLCALLKLNLTSKEISRITGQSVKSLENARTRLRKKLNLTNTNENLNSYLASLE